MEQLKQLNRPEYDCCNYCKYFHPADGITGVCENSLLGRGQKNCEFYHSNCLVGCFHTIHNHYNVESPEYILEYRKALYYRSHLNTIIFYHKQWSTHYPKTSHYGTH